MSFEITFLGCSGGPFEYSNCAMLVKPAHVTYSEILEQPSGPLVMVDAGSGILLLAELIANEAKVSTRLLLLYEDSLPVSEYIKVRRSYPFKDLKGSPIKLLSLIFSKLAGTLLSHPHGDHFMAIVLNLPDMLENSTKLPLYGSEFTADALKKHVFNGYVWPDMVQLGGLELNVLPTFKDTSICNGAYSVTRYDLSHGRLNGTKETYQSLAFLLTCNVSNVKLLAFGDFEADTELGLARNRFVWDSVAPFITDETLKCIILECSIEIVAPRTELYGHLTPRHLIEELSVLSSLLDSRKRKPLKGFQIIVTHVKENFEGKDPRRKIKTELDRLNQQHDLGLNISMAISGVSVIV